MFARVVALVGLTAVGCSGGTSMLVPDGCSDCDMAGGTGGGGGGGGGASCGADCGDMALGDGGVTCGDDPGCGFAISVYRRGRGANFVRAARLDSDGIGDLVVSHQYDISVRLGRADGSYAPEMVLDAGPYPHAFAVADVDGNGRPDLAVTSGNAKQVAIVLAVGDGMYAVERTLPLDGTPVDVAGGDLDGNGRADLAVLTQDPDQLVVFLDAGAGAFAPGVKIALPKTEQALTVVDFDKDGKLDVVAVGPEAQFFRGLGDGTLAPVVRSTAPVLGTVVAVADFDNDGKLDLAIAGNYPAPGGGVEGELGVLIGNGAGGISSATHVAFGLPGVRALVAGEFTGDANVDLAAVRDGGDTLGVAPGAGSGSFGAFLTQAHDLDGDGAPLTGMSALDLDGDGNLDLAASSQSGWVATWKGRGDGAFDPRWYGNVAYNKIAIGDSDGDGKRDLVISSWYPTLASLLRGDGKGAFAAAVDERVPGGATRMIAGDFDGDGKADVVTSSPKGLSLRWGNNGVWTAPAALAGIVAADLAVADMTKDGVDDLVVSGSGELRVLAGGMGATALVDKAVYAVGTNRALLPIAIGDFDGDQVPDVAFATQDAAGVGVALGTGSGTLNKLLSSVSDLRPSTMAAGDWNGDGALDLAVTVPLTTVTLLHGAGDGTFTKGKSFPTGSRAFFVLGGDFDGDGKRDLVLARGGDFNASLDLWRGDGAGNLTPFRQYPRMYLPLHGVAGDLDGDGKPDVAVVDYDGATIFLDRLR